MFTVIADGDGRYPAVAFVDGSGPAERDGWDDEAEVLAGAGFAGLAWDKPGCGDSGGDWRDQSLQDRASEALAAVACLAAQEGVDPARIALLGAEWLPDGDELTPTSKLKRRSILAKYSDAIEDIYR